MTQAPQGGDPPRSISRLLAAVWRYGRWPVIFYLVVCLLMMIFEDSLVFVPSRYPYGNWEPQGLPVEDAWFRSDDGVQLHGWFLERERPRAVVLYLHGNGGNVTHRAHLLRTVHDRLGVSVLVLDYRGYGRSEGRPDETGVLADARAARAWLAERTGAAPSEIVLWGHSLGGSVAVDLAAAEGAKALVLESTFSSAPDVAAYHYAWLPVRPLMKTRLDSHSKIGRYHGPLFQAHGDADTIVPMQFGRRLFEAANEPKRFEVIPGAGHDDVFMPDYYGKLAEFLEGIED